MIIQQQYKEYSTSNSVLANLGFGNWEKGGAYSFKEAKKFPQDSNGYYIPQEYWDEYDLI